MAEVPHPFVKWVGGKAQLLDALVAAYDEVPRPPGYHEPFLGGGAFFFALARLGKLPGRVRLSDANAELINTYKVVRDTPRVLMALLEAHERAHSEAHYYAVRAGTTTALAGGGTPPDRAARFIYLNKAGFNGLYRVNRAGHFNVPWGKRAVVKLFDHGNILACADALNRDGVEIVRASFHDTRPIRPGDFVYYDPPYAPLTATSFTRYHADGFGDEDQRVLAEVFRDVAARGAHALLSNSSAPMILDLYGQWSPQLVDARRAVNRDGAGRGPVKEVLVRSWRT